MIEESAQNDMSRFIPHKNGANISPSFPQYTHQTSEVYKLHAACISIIKTWLLHSSTLRVAIQINLELKLVINFGSS
jgi:hypothetical protein